MASRDTRPLPLTAGQQDACLNGFDIKACVYPAAESRGSTAEVPGPGTAAAIDVGYIHHGLVVLERKDGVHSLYSRDSSYQATMYRKVVFDGRCSHNSAASLEST
jgi:hypothetical protein